MFKNISKIQFQLIRLGVYMLLFSGFQQEAKSQTAPTTVREQKFNRLAPKMTYPLINAGPMSGVLPIEGITNSPDTKKEVRLLFDFTQSTPSGIQAEEINPGLLEVARVINLHAAAGYDPKKIKSVIVFHSGSILSIMNAEYYMEQYKKTNPNLELLEKLQKAGATMVVCGQSLELRDFKSAQLVKGIDVALSAKTTLTKYHQAGFFTFEIKTAN
jgi:intracellular sulfur oxidation DsrE/DsrF family protein